MRAQVLSGPVSDLYCIDALLVPGDGALPGAPSMRMDQRRLLCVIRFCARLSDPLWSPIS